MIAPNLVITQLLLASDELLGMVTADGGVPRIYSPRLMPGWKPMSGTAVVHAIRGGPEPSLHTPIVVPSIQVTVWGPTPKQARKAQSVVYDILHGIVPQIVFTGDGEIRVLWGKAESFPQDVVDPETGWFTVPNFYQLALMEV